MPSEPTISLARLKGLSGLRELVEVVAADAAQDLGEAAFDFVGALGADALNGAVALGFERFAGTFAFEFSASECAEVDDGAVGEHHFCSST